MKDVKKIWRLKYYIGTLVVIPAKAGIHLYHKNILYY